MKLTMILLTAAFLNVTAKSISQNISYSGKNVSLEKVFSEVEKQTGYAFMYTDNTLIGTKPVSVKVSEVSLEEFLRVVLKGQPLRYTIENKTVLLSSTKTTSTTSIELIDGALLPPGDLRGRIINKNGEALAGANVILRGTNLGTTTDNNGYYKITNIALGDYTLEISYVGYKTITATINITEDGAAAFNYTLTPSLVNLDETTVTSTLSKRLVRAYPATIAEIKGKDLENRNLNNIANVLEAIPGVILQPGSEKDNSGAQRTPVGLLIRGTSGADLGIKYLVDGIEITGSTVLQILDPNTIEKIEVLKGPMASTLYGSGAGGGVIAITTKRGKVGKSHVNFKTMFTQQSFDYADYNGFRQDYSLNISGGGEQFNYLLGAAYNLYPITKLSDFSNGMDDKIWSYTAKIRGKVKNIAADLSLQYGNESYGVGSTEISINKYRESIGLSTNPIGELSDVRNYQKNFSTNLHLTHTIANNWYHDLNIGYNLSNYSNANFTQDLNGNYYINDNLSSRMNVRYFMFYDHPWSAAIKSSITGGFEYNVNEIRLMGLTSTTRPVDFFASSTPGIAGAAYYYKGPFSSMGYFAEAVTGFKNNLFLTMGIRYDINPAYGNKVGAYPQPRVGLSYVMEPGNFKIKPRVVWGVSSDAPNPLYKKSYTESTPYYTAITIGNENIKPQRSQGYEFGADIFYSSNYSLNVTWYDQEIKDMIQQSQTYDFNTNPYTFTRYFFNVAEVINRGLEVSAKAVIDPFTLELSYTQTVSKWGKDIGQDPTPTLYPGAPLSNVPKKSLFTRLSYQIPSFLPWSKKGGRISLDWRYNGSAYNFDDMGYSFASDAWQNAPDPKPPYPDYYSFYIWQKGYSYFNLRMDYSVTEYAALYIDVQNLLDKQGSVTGQTLSQFPSRRINFGFNINF